MSVPILRRTSFPSRGFTLIELLVVIAIIGLLVSILVPSVARAKQLAAKVRCGVHLHGLAQAHQLYAGENRDFLPGIRGVCERPAGGNAPWGIWACEPIETGLLYQAGLVAEPNLWLCPAVTSRSPGEHYLKIGYPTSWTQQDVAENAYTYHFSYNARTFLDPVFDRLMPPQPTTSEWRAALAANNGRSFAGDGTPETTGMRKLSTFPNPERTILLAEENTGMVEGAAEVLNDPQFIAYDVTEPRHLGVSQVGYLDGHSGSIPAGINLWVYSDGTTTGSRGGTTEYWPVEPN